MERAHGSRGRGSDGHASHVPTPMWVWVIMAAACLLVSVPGTALAVFTHWGDEGCSSCHTLDSDEGEGNTSYINSAARTINQIRSAAGSPVPLRLGCTFCHSNPLNTRNMDVLSHFGNMPAKHPVGYDMSLNEETEGEVVSTILSNQANELDCIDCHDPAMLDTIGTTLDYFTHAPTVANPYMLRNVTVVNEYEGHCRTCHGASAPAIKGQNVQLTASKAHLDSNTGNAITENDGTPIVPRDGATAVNANDECRACHDSHYSNVAGLFNDGHEKHKNGGGTAETDAVVTQNDCTSFCHYRGDLSGNFDSHGHGKANAISGGVMGLACINCHDSGAEHAGTNASYKTKNRLTYFPDAAGDVSSFGNPLYSICKQCHGTKDYHKSTAPGKEFATACLDCHDEHAEGSGTASNVYMIPQVPKKAGTYGATPKSPYRNLIAYKFGTEAVWYETKTDFYTSAAGKGGQGVCDVIECHGNGVARGFGSLANIMTNIVLHPVGTKATGSDCATDCHPHTGDPAGSFSGEASCTSCHGQPPVSAATQVADYADHNEGRTPHAKHTRPNESGGMNYDCAECHQKGSDPTTHDNDPDTYESVWFNSVSNPGVSAYPSTVDYTTSSSTCNNLYCHSSGSSTSAKGSVQWMTAFGAPDWSTLNLACIACHNNGSSQAYPADAAGNHARHVEYGGATGAIVDCEHCHYGTTTNGTAINYVGALHVNKTKNVVAGSTFAGVAVSFNFTQGTDQCSNISCHGGWTNVTWGTGHSTTCDTCHGSFASTADMSTNTVAKHASSTWLVATNGFDVKHSAGADVTDSINEETCAYCHANNVGAYTTAKHMDAKIQLNSNMNYAGLSGPGGSPALCTGVCHTNAAYTMSDSGYVFETLAGASMGCMACHGNGSTQYWPDGGSSPDRAGKHQIHITRLAARLNYSGSPSYTDPQQKQMCSYCHPNATGSAAFLAVHGANGPGNGVGNVTGYVDYLWTTITGTEQTDAGATYTVANGTCANIACHYEKSTGQSSTGYGWYTTNDGACLVCHTLGGASTADPKSGLHTGTLWLTRVNHDDSFPTGGTCATCHTLPTSTPTSTHVNGATVAGSTNPTADYYIFTAYTHSTESCSGAPVGANCHDGPGDSGSWARKWSTTARNSDGTECANCHGGINESDWTFGTGTHNTNDGNVEHNYSWDTDATTSEVIGNHSKNNGQLDRCDLCHVYVYSTYNTNGAGGIGWKGTTGNDSTYHGDGSLEMNSTAAAVKYNSTSYGCDGQSCHDNGTDADPHKLEKSRWGLVFLAGSPGACNACHGQTNGNYWPDGAATPDRVGQHDIHISRLATELSYGAGPTYNDAQQKTMCAYCHPTTTGTGWPLHNTGVRPVTGYVDAIWTTITATEGTDAGATHTGGTCTNMACHNEKSTTATYGWYATNTSTCLMCHTIGSGTANPTSGLHAGTLTLTRENHDDSFLTGGSCSTCHLAGYMTAAGSHINGTVATGSATNTTADFYVFTAYTDATTGSCSGAPVNTNCHDGIGDAGTWRRLWSTTAQNTDGTECANCHGGVTGKVWTFGLGAHSATDGNVEHNYSWDGDGASSEVIGNHSADTAETDRCNLCHIYQFTGYSSNGTGSIGWVANASNTSTYHGDGSITMNSNASIKYNSTGYGCDLQACHDTGTAAISHRLEDSRWGLRLVVGPVVECYTCHGNETNATYWPDGAATPDRLGEHDIHISRLAAELNYGAGPTYTDAQQKTMCAYCHANPAGAAFTARHNKGYRDVTGYVDFLWTTIGAAESTDTDATLVTAGMTCANFNCHNNQATPAAYGWYAGGASNCIMCHAVGGAGIADPTDGLHDNTPLPTVSGVAHDESFLTGGTCTTCHVYIPAVSNTSTHMANGTMPADGGANTTADFYVFTAYTDSTGACSGAPVNTNCHDGAGDAGTWRRLWSTTAYNSDGTECANCHGGVTGEVWTMGSGAHSTTDGNVEHNYSWDTDGTSSEVVGNHSADTNQYDRCELCHVYQSSGYNTNGSDSHIGWVANTSNTSTYHGNNSIEMNSNSLVRYSSANYGCDSGACHDTGASNYKLEKSRWTVNLLTTGPGPNCGMCHGTSTGTPNFWPDGASSPDRLGEHVIHITRLATKLTYAGTTYTQAQQFTMCAYCHPNVTGSNFPVVHSNGTRNVTGYVDALWTTITATEQTDTGATYVAAGSTCANFDCHNNDATPAAYGWYAGGATACTMCHAAGGSGTADPTSGLHAGTLWLTRVNHDESFPTGGTCTTCHTTPTYSSSSAHMNGSYTAGSTNPTADYYVFTAYTHSTEACSGAPVNTGCHDGVGDAGTWARKWSTTARNSDDTECANCHGGLTGKVWTVGLGAHSTTDGNVEHNYSWDGDPDSSEAVGNHADDASQLSKCEFCHVYEYGAIYTTNAGGEIGWKGTTGNDSTYHGNGSLEMNSNAAMQYNSTKYGCDTQSCHDTGTAAISHRLEKSRWNLNFLAGSDGGGGSCESCHKAGGSGQIVTSAMPHTVRGTTTNNTYNSCGDCHSGHATSTTSILIPNYTKVGIYYTLKNAGGFNFGGTATGGKTTEAEMCWYCHITSGWSSPVISEWGVNNQTDTGGMTYNYGSISGTTGVWNGAMWSSGTTIFSYKNAAIQSTHTGNPIALGYNSNFGGAVQTTANLTGTPFRYTETADATGNIRCSYCHDVHQLNKAAGDTQTGGAPYLRGTWKGNPFNEDGAPMSAGSTFPAQGNFSANAAGGVPRGRAVTADTTMMGGYWIDQNSMTPQSAWTQANSWGLCGLCHGTSVGSLDTHTGENAWINSTKNGHLGVMAATTQNVTNIFDYSHGRTSSLGVGSAPENYLTIGNMADQAFVGSTGYHYRGSGGANSYLSPIEPINSRYAFNSYNWGASVNGTTTDSSFHKFMCSKCHNPHASRLPKLLITNCLDVRHNTWDDNKSTQSRWSNANLRDKSKRAAYWNTAVNCHRYESAYSTANGAYNPGWNKVSPW